MKLKEFEYEIVRHLKSENEQVHYISLIYSILNDSSIEDEDFKIHKNIINSIELLKASTLIIDDIIDSTAERDNCDSFITKYGTNNSLLVGEMLKSHSSIAFIENISRLNISQEAKLKSILIFEDSFRTVLKGQYEDINLLYFKSEMENWTNNEWSTYFEQYISIIYSTTSIFLQIPFWINVQLGNVKDDEIEHYASFFKYMGLAYQLRDDIIDSIGSPNESGKSFGGDILERKIRLPLITFFKKSNNVNSKSQVFSILKQEDEIASSSASEIIDILYEENAVRDSILYLNSVCDTAIKAIENINNEKHKIDLTNISEFLKF